MFFVLVAIFRSQIPTLSWNQNQLGEKFAEENFQTGTGWMALSTNQIAIARATTNHRATSKYQFDITSQ